MSGVPETIPEVGASGERPRLNPKFVPTEHQALSSEEFFVLSRIDGSASLKELILMTGLGQAKTIEILQKLRKAGAFLIGSETPEDVVIQKAEPAKPPVELSDEEQALMNEDCALSDEERMRVIETMRLVRGGDYFALLGVKRDADKRTLKRSYFKLSKAFHPDRYYGKNTGGFAPWLSEIFDVATKAFEILDDERERAAHIASLDGKSPAAVRAQSPAEHAAELFERACQLEAMGDPAQALKLFAGACKVAPDPRYLRRAATCALSAKELEKAEGFAEKARTLVPDDPSYVRILADVFRAQGRLSAAEQTLLQALELRSENDVLMAELAADLAEVRRIRGPD